MKLNRTRRLSILCSLTLGGTLSLLSGALMAGPGTQTEDDIYVGKKRQVQGVTTPASTSPKPTAGAGTSPNTARSAAPPIAGSKTPVPGVATPRASLPPPKPGAGTSPNTAAASKKTTARAGGDNDLDDLDGERRKVQGVNTPGTAAPLLRPGAGTSPNTGRSATPMPGLLPPK
jgi:hypothetical protein